VHLAVDAVLDRLAGSTKPASALYIAPGSGWRARAAARGSRVTSTIIAGDTRDTRRSRKPGIASRARRPCRASACRSAAEAVRAVPFDDLERRAARATAASGMRGNSARKPRSVNARGRHGVVAEHDRHAVDAFQAAEVWRTPVMPHASSSASVGTTGAPRCRRSRSFVPANANASVRSDNDGGADGQRRETGGVCITARPTAWPRACVAQPAFTSKATAAAREPLAGRRGERVGDGGAIGGTPGSPTPVGLSVDGDDVHVDCGISLMRSTR
jgi:hypothetical protein